MKIYFRYNKWNYAYFTALLMLGAVLFFFTHFPKWVLFLYILAAYPILALKIKFNEKLSYLWAALGFFAASVISTYTIQHLILSQELFAKTKDSMLYLNMFCAFILYALFFVITCSWRISFMIVHTGIVLLGMIDYYVYLFRQNEFSFADLTSIGTGLSVSGSYGAALNEKSAYAILMMALMYIFAWKIKLEFGRKYLARIVFALAGIAACIYVGHATSGISTQTWELKGTYQNGYLLNFWAGFRDTVFIKKPKGYRPAEISKLEEVYQNKENSTGTSVQIPEKSAVQNPTVIVIMNESFADLQRIGKFMTNEPVTPFLDSMEKNTVKGYALSSVYGAKTPNSEWEFLTGNSMAFLPSGSVVYQQFINQKPYSLVSAMKQYGYTTVAMHPYFETGWSRNSVYPKLGFDEMYFINDFDQTNLMRKYITDQELYDRMIERFESKQNGENLFLFGVTMQNHGGYSQIYSNFTETIYPLNSYYFDVRQYLTLLHHSDEALKNLITYFEHVEEPVEIVFFGDHQPSLNAGFYRKLNQKGLSGLNMEELEHLYEVPYFIWTNYDSESRVTDTTSLNFLSSMALKAGNFKLPPYNAYLLDLQKTIPAINSRGYYSRKEGTYQYIEDAQGEEKKKILQYQMMQYNNMFDKKQRNDYFFPYWKE